MAGGSLASVFPRPGILRGVLSSPSPPALAPVPEKGSDRAAFVPVVTWTLAALVTILYLWDRQGAIFGPSITFADLAMRPREVAAALPALMRGEGDRFPLVTVLTAMFLHGSVMHLAGNLVFLVVFGAGVEEALGSARFALYYLAWGVAAAAAQIWTDPTSTIPTLGASGAIGGALGAYFLLFPASKIEIALPFVSFDVKAFFLLGAWFLWQVFVRQDGVANWAHVGGFVAGMLTVLSLGGRAPVLVRAGLDPSLPDG